MTPDGVTIPKGCGTDSNVKNTSLLYNEYPLSSFIVYLSCACPSHIIQTTCFFHGTCLPNNCWCVVNCFKKIISFTSSVNFLYFFIRQNYIECIQIIQTYIYHLTGQIVLVLKHSKGVGLCLYCVQATKMGLMFLTYPTLYQQIIL